MRKYVCYRHPVESAFNDQELHIRTPFSMKLCSQCTMRTISQYAVECIGKHMLSECGQMNLLIFGKRGCGVCSQKCSGNHDGRIIENSRSIGGFKSLSGMLLEQLSGRRNVGDCVWKMNTLSDEAVTDCRSKVGNAQLNNWLL